MGLFPQIDKQATIDKVRHFFWDDDQFEGICLRAGDYGLRSPQLDLTGIKGSSVFNSTDYRLADIADCLHAVYAVREAIQSCRYSSKVILKERFLPGFIDRMYIKELAPKLCRYSDDGYKSLEERACLDFADIIEPKCEIYHVDRKLVPDFHVYFKSGMNRGSSGDRTGTTRG